MAESTEVTLNISAADFSLEEVEEISELVGWKTLEEFGEKMPAKALGIIAWVIKRRSNPAYTLDEARKLRMSEFTELLDPNAVGGVAAVSSGNGSVPSASSTRGARRKPLIR